MEKELNEYLREGETVRWSGRTAPFPLMGERTREQIIFKWVATAAATCALLGTYCSRDGALSWKFIGLVVFVALLIIATPWIEQGSIMKQKYFVTNQRVIFLMRDKSMFYMELSELDGVQRVSLNGEADTLVLGSVIFEDIRRQLRWRACHPKTNLQGQEGQDKAIGLVLYGIRDADIAQSLLQQATAVKSAKTA